MSVRERREMQNPDTVHDRLVLWDALLAEDIHPTLHLVDYVCLAMLLRIRDSLLDSDCNCDSQWSWLGWKANLSYCRFCFPAGLTALSKSSRWR